MDHRPHYRTWIRSTRLAVFAALSIACLAGSALAPLSLWFLLFLVPFAVFGYIAMILTLTIHRFAPRGGDLERKSDGMVEALRVLRPGGRYVFLDLFGDPAFYPSADHVRETIRGAGASIVEFDSLAGSLPLPFPLRHPKVLGHAMLIVGTKTRP